MSNPRGSPPGGGALRRDGSAAASRGGPPMLDEPSTPYKILVVDDNEAARYALRRHLEREGFIVTDAATGRDALAEAIVAPLPNLVILDVNLPDISGFEVCRRLRVTPSTARIPVLQLSATSIDAQSQVSGLEAGADAYLVEPVDRNVLVATVHALLRAARAEHAADRLAREWQGTFDAVTNPVALVGNDGMIKRANAAFGSLVRRMPLDCVGLAFETALDEVGASPQLHAFAALLATGVRQTREGEIGDRWYRLAFDPIRDEDGTVLRAAASLTDLDERRRAELEATNSLDAERRRHQAAQAARQLLEAIVEQFPVALSVAEPSGKILVANREVENTWRRAMPVDVCADDYAALPGFRFDGHRYRPEEWPLSRTLATGETVEGEEIEIERGDGTRATISVSSGPVRDPSGALVAAVVTWMDVTSRREAEALRETFISVLSHELRTPVTTIYAGALMLARKGRLTDDVRAEVLEDVAAEAERLQRIVENLLIFARIERGANAIEAQPVLIQRVLDRVVDDEERRWPAAHFETATAPDLPAVAADENFLELVLRNLLSNAAKYGPDDGTVVISVEPESDWVAVRVLDRGPGVPSGEEDRLFRVFYRSKLTAGKAPGAGIGLFIVRSLIEQMGGGVWAQSRADGGSEFGFRLPVFRE